MGLDINVYAKVELTDPHTRCDDCFDEHDHIYACGHPSQFASTRGLVLGRCYRSAGEFWRFHAGPYGYYGRYRDTLARSALGVSADEVWDHLDDYQDKPFYEQIHFADNEGTISGEACADLAIDYGDERVYALMIEAGFKEKYEQFAKAFSDAAGEGIVEFT